ncbi:MAG: DEAD/DEAH box helicase [Desulfurococcales archaeon]|jgi:helicase|nr:DEAD/DEAH box helicase [Desulfurococcales archaeon]
MVRVINNCPRDPIAIDQLDIPSQIVSRIIKRGYKYLTPPQAEAVRKGLFQGKNIIVSAPTASGKTLIAEMALVNSYLLGGIGIYTCPLKALANEKFSEFREWEEALGLRVGISTGDYDRPGEELGSYDIIVTTYERLDSIFRHRPEWLSRVKVLVIDEIHEIGDTERGPVIEMIVARAIKMGIQIIGLSATIGNPEDLSKWVMSELIYCDWRPVPLIQGFYDRSSGAIYFEDGRVESVKGDLIGHMVSKAYLEDQQLLIFRHSRREAEAMARSIADKLGLLGQYIMRDNNRAAKLVEELKERSSARIEYESLSPLILKGVAYHHAGLSLGSRSVIEKGFRERILKVVVATPTLAAGVNLPARRVIIYTRRYSEGEYEDISIMEYKQMAGRAGRPQYDPYGEVIIADRVRREAERYIYGSPEELYSSLSSKRSLRIHTLSLIASGYAKNRKELMDIFSLTFYGYRGGRLADDTIKGVLKDLNSWGMIRIKEEVLSPTQLGLVVAKQYLDPLSAKRALDILATRGDIAEDLWYLHIISYTPDFLRSITRRGGYRDYEEEAYRELEQGHIPPPHSDDLTEDEWLMAYRYAKILKMWIDEESEDTIVEKLAVMPGDLRVVIEAATWISYALSVISSIVPRVKHHSRPLEKLSVRIENGVREELIPLVKIKGIGRVRARVLYNIGIRSIDDLRKTDPKKLLTLRGFGETIVRQIYEQLGRNSLT